MNKKETIEKYKDIILACNTYGENNSYYVNDLINQDDLEYILYDSNKHEVRFTKKGFLFLEEYYGIDSVKSFILKEIKAGVDFNCRDEKEVDEWLNEMKENSVDK